MSATQGSWQVLPYTSPILPVHAALLPPGTDGRSKILFFCGSGNDPTNTGSSNGSPVRDYSVVWDYENGTFYRPQTLLNGANYPIDFFCAGQSFLADGRLLVAGGTEQYEPSFHGLPDTLVFDPKTLEWTIVQSMASGRWYPTLVTLRDGNIFACSGKEENGFLDTYPEIYSPSTGWTVVSPNKATSELPMYAHIFLMRDGRLFYSGGYFDNNNAVSPRILTLPTPPGTITEQPVNGLEQPNAANQAASVLLPPADQQRVMIIGGGDPSKNGMATNRVNIVQLPTAAQAISNPTYTKAAYLKYARQHHNAVLLPDRTVFVCGGGAMYEAQATLAAEIYNPATNTWTEVASEGVPRFYHSVALLLPDGRVISAGGNPKRVNECVANNRPRQECEELRISIYSPPYLFKGARPVISSAPQQVTYGQQFQIQTPQAGNIKWINLIKPMATTHGLDTEQRLQNVVFSKSGTTLNATLTSNRNLAPPGFYMLSITDTNGVPSIAKWIQITA